jgi:formylglycine-generating enzyme required for sulfatase activity
VTGETRAQAGRLPVPRPVFLTFLVKTVFSALMNSKIAPVAASLFIAATLIVHSSAQSDTFGTGSNQFTLDFVNVGNTANTNSSLGYGAVPYEYRIGKYEISQHQVTKATQLGLTGVSTTASSTNRPAASATWYEAAAFVNFLNTNSGKTAAYNLSLSGSTWSMTLQAANQAWTLGGTNLYRNKDAFYFLPSENEWFKAAYYNPTNTTYYTYPLGSNSAPSQLGNLGGTNPGTAVYLANIFQPGPAEIERAGGLSPYGAMGLAGNAWDWVESSFDGANTNASADRTFRGAAAGRPAGNMISSYRQSVAPTIGNDDMGFRVASVPEPSTYVLVLLGAGAIYLWKRRCGANRRSSVLKAAPVQ